MTREEADKLQEQLDDYAKRSANPEASAEPAADVATSETDYDAVGAAFKRLKARCQPLAIESMRHTLARVIEPYIPSARIPGVDFDLVAMIGLIAGVRIPGVFDAEVRLAVVDGHEGVDGDGDREGHIKKYGVTVPGDILKEAMNIRTARDACSLALDHMPTEKKSKKKRKRGKS